MTYYLTSRQRKGPKPDVFSNVVVTLKSISFPSSVVKPSLVVIGYSVHFLMLLLIRKQVADETLLIQRWVMNLTLNQRLLAGWTNRFLPW